MTTNTPDTPTSVLALAPTSRQAIALFADLIIDGIKAGDVNPLQVKIQLKAFETLAKFIDANVSEEVLTEARKFSEDKQFEFAGAICQVKATSTRWDFTGVNDLEYLALLNQLEDIETKVTAREAFLKNLPNPMEVINDSGEVYTISPPKKIQKDGISITFK